MSIRPLPSIALVPVLALAFLGVVRGEEDPSTRVVRRVQAAVHEPQTPHFNSRDVQRTELVRLRVAEAGRQLTIPILPPGCGMGVFGGLDVERTVELATELLAIHGIALQPDGLAAGLRLDALDPEAKVGLLIQPAALGDARVPVKEGSTKALKALERAGYRVLVLPLGHYRCMQADTSSPMHACALTLVEFLADVTGTRRVDLSVLAQGESIDIEGTGLAGGVADATTFELSDAGAFLVLESEASVELAFAPPATVRGRGRPTLLTLPFYWTPPLKEDGTGYDLAPGTPAPSFTLLQDGMGPIASGRAVFLTDGAFDPAQPFRIRIALQPGQTHLGSAVRVRTTVVR